MSKKILYIDMDGVLADFAGGIKKVCGKDIDPADNNDWVYEVCEQNPQIFHDLPPIPLAIETVKKLFDHYDVFFLSAPMWRVPESYTGKRVWLEKHFGEHAKDKLILTTRKDLHIGDILVDDRLKHGVDKFTGLHIHFGQKPYEDWFEVALFLNWAHDKDHAKLKILHAFNKY